MVLEGGCRRQSAVLELQYERKRLVVLGRPSSHREKGRKKSKEGPPRHEGADHAPLKKESGSTPAGPALRDATPA